MRVWVCLDKVFDLTARERRICVNWVTGRTKDKRIKLVQIYYLPKDQANKNEKQMKKTSRGRGSGYSLYSTQLTKCLWNPQRMNFIFPQETTSTSVMSWNKSNPSVTIIHFSCKRGANSCFMKKESVCMCNRIFYLWKKKTRNGNKNRDERMKATLLVVSALFSISYYFFITI